MNKQLPYTAIIYFLCRTFFVGIAFYTFIQKSRQDAWISAILGILLGIIPLLAISYIANYEEEKSLKEKIRILFPRSNKVFILFLSLCIFSLTILSYWNLSNLITSQFLNKTPKYIISIAFLIPIFLLIQKDKKIISRVSLVLFYFSFFLFILTFLGLINQFQLNNFKPLLQNNIFSSLLPYLGFHIFPIFLILFFPNQEIKKSLPKGYLLANATILITILLIIGVLGVDVALIYQYPEFNILKRAYQNILTYRLENFLAIQWIFDIFIFCTISLKGCNELLNLDTKKKNFILPILMFLISPYLFKDNTIANNIIKNVLGYGIFFLFSLIILILVISISHKKRRNSPIYLNTENQQKLE